MNPMRRNVLQGTLASLALLAGMGVIAANRILAPSASSPANNPLPTGKWITPTGTPVGVGSFPANMAISPDGRWLAVTTTGFRQQVSILDANTGQRVSALDFNGPRATRDRTPDRGNAARKAALYYGLAFGPSESEGTPLYVSRGPEDAISVLRMDGRGNLSDTGRTLDDASGRPKEAGESQPHFPAGVVVSADGAHLFVANNQTSAWSNYQGSVSIFDTAQGQALSTLPVPGFPYAVAAKTRGRAQKLFVGSERDSLVSALEMSDPRRPRLRQNIPVGDHPDALLLDRDQKRLFVANAGSDTVSIVDTRTDRVLDTVLLRPAGARGLPGATPTGLCLCPEGTRLYVTLADMNAVAVIALDKKPAALRGYIPVGWYPTSIVMSRDGKRLFVANAKGVQARNPNGKAVGPDGKWGQYIENILEGAVSTLAVPTDAALPALTRQTLANNRLTPGQRDPAHPVLTALRSKIRHVIYIIKENRTYDQVLGDLPQGNGDPSLVLFGREVTPNQHALAERFALLDNFHVCAEVSADGWDWSLSGMISEYTARNAPFKYSERGRNYDFEGEVNGSSVDLMGQPDVARAPSGYLWDNCARHGVSYRTYGIYLSSREDDEAHGPGGKWLVEDNMTTKRALIGHFDRNYAQPLPFADSAAWVVYNTPAPKQTRTFGNYHATSRYAEWKREFDGFVKRGDLPALSILTLQRDHTMGTTPGQHSPRAMVADNDYAVGQLVEAVSKSRYWKETAIFLIEDDAQNGLDHVDSHRSPCYVISPYIPKATIDHHFYNTDSVIHTLETLLGLPPMCQYDATAPLFRMFGTTPVNAAPFQAILPPRAIVGELNTATAYRAHDSAKLDFRVADRVPETTLNAILWHAIKGANVPQPAIRR